MKTLIESRIAQLENEKTELLKEYPASPEDLRGGLAERNMRISLELKFLNKLRSALEENLFITDAVMRLNKQILSDFEAAKEREAITFANWLFELAAEAQKKFIAYRATNEALKKLIAYRVTKETYLKFKTKNNDLHLSQPRP